MATLLAQLSELGSLFSGIATGDPISAILVAIGAVLTLGSIAALGYLALRAGIDLFLPDRVGRVRRPGA